MTTMNGPVDIVVRGRHLELSQRFREHVIDKLGRVDRFGVTLSRVDVEVTKEANPRQADRAFEVELTMHPHSYLRADARCIRYQDDSGISRR